MKEHLKEALMGVRAHLLKVKAGKYNEDEKDEPSVAPKANSGGSDNGASFEPEVSRKPEAPTEDLDDKEVVTFFRKRKQSKVGNERIVGLGAKR